jgi:effector-binding domain-containing protein
MPFEGTAQPADGMQVRTEPAHAEAFTTLTRQQVQFPEILEAYEAVERWIDDHGRTVKAAPREVYFTSEEPQRPDEPFCDVAFPIP